MSFFDELDESVYEYLNSNDDLLDNTHHIGDVVYYDPINFSFMVASKTNIITPEDIKNWNIIMIGIIININDNNDVDVLMSGFLTAQSIRIPFDYHRPAKRKYIRNYIKDLYRRYVSAFFKQCPSYQDLLKLDIEMPDVDDMKKIHADKEQEIFDNLKICTDDDSFNSFYKRLRNNYFYVMHKGLMYQMKIQEDEDVDIIIPDAINAEFLCVFKHVNLYERLMSAEVKNDDLFND